MEILLAEFATNTNNYSANNGTHFKVVSESHLCSSLKDRYSLALIARPNVRHGLDLWQCSERLERLVPVEPFCAACLHSIAKVTQSTSMTT